MTEQQQGLRGAFALPTESDENYWIEWALGKWRKGDKDSVHTAYGQCRPDSKQAIVQSLLETLEILANDTSQPVNAPFIEMALELIQATEDKSFLTGRGKDLPTLLGAIYPRLAPADQKTFMAALDNIKNGKTAPPPVPPPPTP